MIVLDSVVKKYKPGIKALDKFSCQFKDGLHIVKGESGSGKTTLLLVCAGFLKPDSGVVNVLGRALYRKDDSSFISSNIGAVFQVPLLIPYLNVVENVMLSSKSRTKIGKKAARDKAYELLDSVGLYSRRKSSPSELSGGERQRVAYCRAVYSEPSILVADEPTASLDVESGKILAKKIFEYSAVEGRVVLVTTHDPHFDFYSGESRYNMEKGVLVCEEFSER